MVFDLLYWHRRDLTGRALRDRRAHLEDVVAGSELVSPVRRLTPDGLEAWKQAGSSSRWRRLHEEERIESPVELLARRRSELSQALGLRERVGAPPPPPAQLKRGIARDDPVVDGIASAADEVGVVSARIAARVLRLLKRRGLDPADATELRSAPERRPGAADAEVRSLPPERFCIPVEWLLAHPAIP